MAMAGKNERGNFPHFGPRRTGPSESGKNSPHFTISRRNLLVAAGSTVALGAVGAAVHFEIFTKPQEYSGEVGETRDNLKQLQTEVGMDREKFEEILPRLTGIAAAYFTREMKTMFPDRAGEYSAEDLRSRIAFVDPKAFQAQITRCGVEDKDASSFRNVLGKTAYFNKDVHVALGQVGPTFFDILQQLHLTAPPLLTYDRPSEEIGMPVPATHLRGLVAARQVATGSICADGYRISADITVVQDSTIRMSDAVGVVIGTGPHFKEVAKYRSVVLKEFNRDHKELLGHQQASEPDVFFQKVGAKYFPKAPGELQMHQGFQIMRSLQNP